MRQLKFRAWDGKEMHQNVVIVDGNSFKNEKWAGFPMQFTELKDKNGLEVYEGDIVEEPYFSNVNPADHDDEDYFDDTPRKYVVCYDSKQAKYKMVPISTYLINAGNGGFTGYEVKYERISVIGNVCENAELLK